MLIPKRWRQEKQDSKLIHELKNQLGISEMVAQILVNRGINTAVDAHEFLNSHITDLPSPFEFSDMKQAVTRIKKAIHSKEQVVVYGDYDVDGITSTAIIFELLNRIGAKVTYYIPERIEEGYGLNSKAIEQLAENNCGLIITVDCGITSNEEVNLANQLGIDVIITDHHEPLAHLPAAFAIINPKLENKVFPHFAGVGVAFKLAQALHLTLQLPLYEGIVGGEYLDLVALGTIADIVPLIGENRVLVKYGLPCIENTWRLGLKSLIEETGLWGKVLSPSDVAFTLAPRINAAGRISSPLTALELLLTEDMEQATNLAVMLNEENLRRQQVEQQILEEAEQQISNKIDLDVEKIIVLASEKWHSGVVGIVASKIVEKYHRPTIMIALKNHVGKGSCRSITNFDMHKCLETNKHLLLKFGGHHQAAGLSIAAENIQLFRKAINEYANQVLSEENLQPYIKIDTKINLNHITDQLFAQLEVLAPFGFGNPKPVFCSDNVKLAKWSIVGKDRRHLKVVVSDGDKQHDGIGFNFSNYNELAAATDSVNVAFALEQHNWQGKKELQLILKDIKPYFAPATTTIAVSNDFNFIDARQIKNRTDYFAKYKNSKNLVYVYSHEMKQMARELFLGEEELEFVVANQSLINKNEKKYDQLFLYNPPLHWQDLKYLVTQSNWVCMCFNSIPEAELLKYKFPDRASLGKVYLFLREFVDNQETRPIAFRELFGNLYHKFKMGPEDAQVHLNILTELELIHFQMEQNRQFCQISIIEGISEKKDLATSDTYQQTSKYKELYNYWISFWLFTPKVEVEKTFFS